MYNIHIVITAQNSGSNETGYIQSTLAYTPELHGIIILIYLSKFSPTA
jgi:hypothetical protein